MNFDTDHALAAAFIGTRAEALIALMSHVPVTSILCIADSHAHVLCEKEGWSATVFGQGGRTQAMDWLGRLEENLLLSAGFPWIIDESTLSRCPSVRINSHPSLLPRFPGRNAIREALAAGSTHLGVSVHHMIPDVDAGSIITQESVDIRGMELSEIYALLFSQVEPRAVGVALRSVFSGHPGEVTEHS